MAEQPDNFGREHWMVVWRSTIPRTEQERLIICIVGTDIDGCTCFWSDCSECIRRTTRRFYGGATALIRQHLVMDAPGDYGVD